MGHGKRSTGRRLPPWMAVVGVFGVLAVLAALLLPGLLDARRQARQRACRQWHLDAAAHAREAASRFTEPLPLESRAGDYTYWLSVFEETGYFTEPPGSGIRVERPEGCAQSIPGP